MIRPEIRILALAAVLAVVTTLPAAAQQVILADEDFESGTLPAGWTHFDGGANPSCSEVSFLNVGIDGLSMVMASNAAGCSQATGVRTAEMDVSGCSVFSLYLLLSDLGDEDHTCPSSWTIYNPPEGDCMGLSQDGIAFMLVDEWEGLDEYQVLLRAAEMPNPGMTSVWLYFSESDDEPPLDDGIALDNFVAICDPEEADCADGIDDDYDGFIDCMDLDCLNSPDCTEVDCANGVDDDGNGFADCCDADCLGDPACAIEDCANGVDDDGNGFADCQDCACYCDGACPNECGLCDDGIDNDGDGYTDCSDDECWMFDPVCVGVEVCDNGLDDNGDALVDCEDPQCALDPLCDFENCGNGVDDDGNGLIDCDDPECVYDPACTGEVCDNGVDDDGDGYVDCDDPECAFDPACTGEDCLNGVDDNGDGLVDCADPICALDPACNAEDCVNGVDDNGNGLVDCADPMCALDPAW